MKYIKKIVLRNDNTMKDLELEFKEGTNIIVGPKGGGKSTLLVLLYLAHKNAKNLLDEKLSKATWQALKAFSISFKSLHYSDGTMVTQNTLSAAISSNEEFVTQSDEIKTRINESEKIEKDKKQFIEALVVEQAKSLITTLGDYYQSFDEFYSVRTKRVDWKVIEKYENKKSNYYVDLKKLFQKLSDVRSTLNVSNTLKSIALLELYKKINNGDERISQYLQYIDALLSIHQRDLENHIHTLAIKKGFESNANLLAKEVEKDTSIATKVSAFESDANRFVEELAKTLAKNSAAFYYLVSSNTTIKLKGSRKSNYDIVIAIDDTIEIEQNESEIFEIFTKSLYKNKKDNTKWVEWIKASIDSSSARKKIVEPKDEIYTLLSKKIEEKIQLLIDGNKDYNKMSLGQKTSFGLKYKIQNNQTNFVFLDQPEDNIDSFTITSTLIPLLMKKRNDVQQQAFIVTHNSNFGILTNPMSITSCNLSDSETPYSQIFDPTIEVITKEIELADSPLAHYLEGGKKALKDRYDILIKESK